MTPQIPPQRYSSTSILLHWLTLVLLLGVYLTAELQEGGEAGELAWWHYGLGLTVFAVAWLRIVARIVRPAPSPVDRGWRNVLAKTVHAALYVLMIAAPLLGWAMLSAEGDPVSFFGIPLPSLVGTDRALAHQLEEAHELLGTVGYGLIGLHAAAALFHHFVLRDQVMTRMLAGRARDRT